MEKKKRADSERRRALLLRRLDDALAESIDTRRRLVNRLHHEEDRADLPEDAEPGPDESTVDA